MPRILVGTDGSEYAEHAARDAVRLFGPPGQAPGNHEYTVVSVAPGPLATGTAAVTPNAEVSLSPEAWQEIEDATREASNEQADRAAAIVLDAAGGGPEASAHIKTIVMPGDPAEALCRVAGEMNADVIVIGSRGSGWIARLVTGSVSTHVVHHAPCPVLVVRDPDHRNDSGSS